MHRIRVAAGTGLLVIAPALLPARLSAQGPKSVAITPYGATCAFFNQPATLRGSYDAPTCVLTLTLTKSATCCNTFPSAQILMIGFTPIVPGIQVPGFVPGCVASLVPLLAFAQPASAGGVFKLPLPPISGPVTFYAQGINDYFTTIGMTHDFQTSDAVRLDAQ